MVGVSLLEFKADLYWKDAYFVRTSAVFLELIFTMFRFLESHCCLLFLLLAAWYPGKERELRLMKMTIALLIRLLINTLKSWKIKQCRSMF